VVNINFIKINNIRKINKKCKVYDIVGVKDNHNFIANDMVVHNCDEAIDFAAAQNWNKRENKELKIKFGKIRTKHLLFILCWPWKINKLDKVYFESNINYWCDLFTRGEGAVFVKDLNPCNDPWKLDIFKDIGSFTEFTNKYDIERIYQKHPNFWSMVRCNKPSAQFYQKYLAIREANVYNNKDVMDSMDENDIIRAFIINSLEEVFMKGATKGYKRIQKHLKEIYNFDVKETELKDIFTDAKQLVDKRIEEISKSTPNTQEVQEIEE